MTIMLYVYCPLTVVIAYFCHSCGSCSYALKYFCNVELMALYAFLAGNDVTSFNANQSATWQEVMRRHHCQWTVNIYHNSHHGCYLTVKIVSNILKKAQGRKFEKE